MAAQGNREAASMTTPTPKDPRTMTRDQLAAYRAARRARAQQAWDAFCTRNADWIAFVNSTQPRRTFPMKNC
jgi:hypothetical protein